MSLRELYQEIIVDHGKNPRCFGKLSGATHCQMGNNPLCGDKLMLYVIAKEGVLQAAGFEGTGCAISMASASLMIEAIKGKSTAAIDTLFQQFHELLTSDAVANEEALGKLAAFSGVKEFPMRVKCATLAWHTLKAALANDPNPVSTES